jgi:peptidoglycan/LPS O-acetylase OafA/YrhL
MIGGLLGYLSLGKRPRFRFQNALGLPGLALIASAVYFIDSNRSFPGWWALLLVEEQL